MGGGGGGGWFGVPRGSGRLVSKEAAETERTSRFEAEANEYLQDLLSSFNGRDTEAIGQHIDVLNAAIQKEIEGTTKMVFGGSVSKHTYADGLSDVDALLVVNKSSLSKASPQEVLEYVADRIRQRLPDTEVKVGALAVSVKYSDGIEIQILPAIRRPTGIQIATIDGSGWSNVVRPQEFARKLTQVNQDSGNKVIPVIKLFKGLQSQLPDNSQLKGYHIESLAIEAFRDYTGRTTYKDMLHHFVQVASARVGTPIAETTGQSRHVDDYLGSGGSQDRRRVARALSRLTRKLDTADLNSSTDLLRDAFGD